MCRGGMKVGRNGNLLSRNPPLHELAAVVVEDTEDEGARVTHECRAPRDLEERLLKNVLRVARVHAEALSRVADEAPDLLTLEQGVAGDVRSGPRIADSGLHLCG